MLTNSNKKVIIKTNKPLVSTKAKPNIAYITEILQNSQSPYNRETLSRDKFTKI